MSPRIYLHVGSPKTGTTFLQQVLWSQREVARQQGLLLPRDSFFDHFLATLDVRGLAEQSHHPEHVAGIWESFVAESLAWTGPSVLISHELFAGATEDQAAAAVKAFGDAEVHLVLTARDLVRQIPAEWQEHVKHRSTESFADFVERIRQDDEGSTWFWQVQDFASVVRRWGRDLPASRVHVVTVPPRGTGPEVLWGRFAGLLGLEPEAFDLGGTRSNVSLGAEQVELLRRVNSTLGERLPLPGPYPADVKEVFAQQVLAHQPGVRFGLDRAGLALAARRSARIVEELRTLGVDVVGDLAELTPAGGGEPAGFPDVGDATLLAESVEALAGLLDQHRARRTERDEARTGLAQVTHERDALRAERDDLERRLTETTTDRDRLVHDMRYRPVQHLFIGLSERWSWLMKVRVGYWRTVNAGRAVARKVRRGS